MSKEANTPAWLSVMPVSSLHCDRRQAAIFNNIISFVKFRILISKACIIKQDTALAGGSLVRTSLVQFPSGHIAGLRFNPLPSWGMSRRQPIFLVSPLALQPFFQRAMNLGLGEIFF